MSSWRILATAEAAAWDKSAAPAKAFGKRLGPNRGRQFFVREVGDLHALNLLSDKAFNRRDKTFFVRGDQGQRIAHIDVAAGAPNPMDVIFGVLRHIVIDH